MWHTIKLDMLQNSYTNSTIEHSTINYNKENFFI